MTTYTLLVIKIISIPVYLTATIGMGYFLSSLPIKKVIISTIPGFILFLAILYFII